MDEMDWEPIVPQHLRDALDVTEGLVGAEDVTPELAAFVSIADSLHRIAESLHTFTIQNDGAAKALRSLSYKDR
jgi:hypothetical protein